MTPEQKREGAFEDLEELLLAGIPTEQAIVKAAEANEMRSEVFLTVAETTLGDLRAYRERLLSNAEHERFLSILKREIRKCAERAGVYRAGGFLQTRAIELLEESTADSLGRRLTDIEANELRQVWKNRRKLQLKAILTR